MTRRLAIVSSAAYLSNQGADSDLVEELSRVGVVASVHDWADPAVPWERVEAALIRSTWDYHTRLEPFLAWCERAGRLTRLINPPARLRWNADKRYLFDLERVGLPIIPTLVVSRGASIDRTLAAIEGWYQRLPASRRRVEDGLLLKPSVSAGSENTHRVTLAGRELANHLERLADRDLLVQPFCARVLDEGELSLIYFAGRFSHAVQKRPVAGDFRVQSHFGGDYRRAEAPERLCALAELAFASLLSPAPLYARFDFIDLEQPMLIELELIEPDLYFGVVPEARGRFVRAIVAELERPVAR